jgi:YidC/Oxa1 family membrane protein insertase
LPHLLNWLYTAISWVLLRWHDFFSLFMPAGNGWTWVLSIVFLVVTLRLILFPLFVKQVHSMQAMQKLQPKIAAVRAKYKDDKQAQTRAMMEVQREAGVNPLGGCLPLLAQTPVFISLYHVLRHLQPGNDPTLYGWSESKFDSAVHAKILGAPLPASFRSSEATLHALSADVTSTRIVIIVLLLLSCAATFTTQWQSYQRNKNNLEGQQATIQKFMLYVLPFGLLFTGIVFPFPLGVLIYWVSNNIWTMGQQYYIFKRIAQKDAETAEAAVVDTKALAPKPGQKPTQSKNARPRPGQQPTPKPKPTPRVEPAVAEAGDAPRQVSRPVSGPGSARRPQQQAKRPARSGGSQQRKKKRR